VIVVGEGPTEERFINTVLCPELVVAGIFPRPVLINTSTRNKGGSLSRKRVLRFLRNTLRHGTDTYVTTFFDLYGLRSDFPGKLQSANITDPLAKAEAIEQEFHSEVIRDAGCRADRFFAHIQPYEFEALLFSGTSHFGAFETRWRPFVDQLHAIRSKSASPEHINDGIETHPYARLDALLKPRYGKILHGPALASHIGLKRIRSECAHFNRWLERIESLAPLQRHKSPS